MGNKKSYGDIFGAMLTKEEKPIKEKKVEPIKVEEPVKEEPKEVVVAPVAEKKHSKATEKNKKYLLRINDDFFDEIMMYSKIKKDSINNIIELALIHYLNSKENIDDYKKAKDLASKL